MSVPATRPKSMPFLADLTLLPGLLFALRLFYAEQKMLGKNDLVDNLSRDLDRARGKRDALASDVTALTAQIAEIEARLSEEKKRRERNHVLGEIEAIKKRIIQTASAYPLLRELDRRADAVRVGHAALDLPCLANEAPTKLPKDNNDRVLRLLRFPIWLSRSKEVEKRETAENPHSTAA